MNIFISCNILPFVTELMTFFSIRDIENLTGIKAHTLRIWEQRHNLFNPKRKQSKHRIYDCDDLKYLLRIAYLYNHGYKISRIAGLSEEEIRRLALELKSNGENYEIFINQLTEAAIDFDEHRFNQILHNLVMHAGFEKSVLQVIFPLLKKIGVLWLTGKMHPCQEHFASALIIKKLNTVIDQLERPVYIESGQRRVLLFTPEAEFHEIPLLFMQYLLRKKGVSVIYAGHNVSEETLQTICRHQPVTQLYFHLITNLIGCELSQYLQRLSTLFPDKEIVCGCSMGCQSAWLPNNVRLLNCEAGMMKFV